MRKTTPVLGVESASTSDVYATIVPVLDSIVICCRSACSGPMVWTLFVDGVGVLNSRLLEARRAEDVLTGVEPRTLLWTFNFLTINVVVRVEKQKKF